jgi:GTPase SAR1 family protein
MATTLNGSPIVPLPASGVDAARRLLDDETWVRAGNAPDCRGTSHATPVSRVRNNIGRDANLQAGAFFVDINRAAEASQHVSEYGLTGHVELQNTGICALPDELFAQVNLESLCLSDNPSLSGPLAGEIGRLANLIDLFIDHTALTELPVELENLQQLKLLDMRGMLRPVRVPASVFQCLPPTCVIPMTATHVIVTFENAADVQLPVALTRRIVPCEASDVLAYLRVIAQSAALVLPTTMRIMVVGQADSGKTTLVEKLAGTRGAFGTWERVIRSKLAARVVTFGVDVTEWQTESELGELRLMIVDFAGEPEYHPTHELFLAQDALYLLVFSAKRALERGLESVREECQIIEGWMQLVGSRAPGARVIVVGTRADSPYVRGEGKELLVKQLSDAAERGAKASGLRLVGHELGETASPRLFLVDALKNKVGDLPELAVACKAGAIASMRERDSVPAGLLEAARTSQALLAGGKTVMSRAEFDEEMSKDHSWYSGVVPMLLRHSGTIEYFDSVPGLADFIFLSPEWLAKMLAFVVVQKDLSLSVTGRVDNLKLQSLWRDAGCNDFTCDALIRVMAAFGLVRSVEGSDSELVMPSLLATWQVACSEPTVVGLLDRLKAVPTRRIRRREYSFSVYCAGLFGRVFALLHGDQASRLLGWRGGLVLEAAHSSSGVELLRADSTILRVNVTATDVSLVDLFEKALLTVRDVLFPYVSVFREGILISLAPADDVPSALTPSVDSALSLTSWKPARLVVRVDSPAFITLNSERDLEGNAGPLLGEGSFGRVERRLASATSAVLSPGASYALKELQHDIQDIEQVNSFQHECRVMRELAKEGCQNIVAAVGAEFADEAGTAVSKLLMPLFDASLDDVILGQARQNEEWFDAVDDICPWMLQICRGLAVIHRAGWAHLDLKVRFD